MMIFLFVYIYYMFCSSNIGKLKYKTESALQHKITIIVFKTLLLSIENNGIIVIGENFR